MVVALPIPISLPRLLAEARLDQAVEWSELGRNVAQIAAVVVGGFWAYWKFIRKREDRPRATLRHRISAFDLGEDRRLVRVVEEVTNAGEVLLSLSKRETRIQQVLPANEDVLRDFRDQGLHEVPWTQLTNPHVVDETVAPPEIEPGENDHFEHDFVIPSWIQVVQIYSYFENATRPANDDRGWTLTTTHDLRKDEHTDEEMTDLRAKEV